MSSELNLRDDVRDFVSEQRPMLIGGEWVNASTGKVFSVHNPATGEELGQVADASLDDVDAAVAAARAAFESKEWRRMAPSQRGEMIWKLADLIMGSAEQLIQMEVLNQGKIQELARHLDVEGACDTLRYYSGWCTKLEGTTLDISWPDFRGEEVVGPAHHAYSTLEPVGVVAGIVPWNVPLVMAIAKIGPALAAGCTIVLRPAQETPLTTLRLGELIQEAGFPPGVVNIITGYGRDVPAALAAHMDVDKVAYTGSTFVGKQIAAAAATSNLKKVSLELGGNRPVVICDDADLDAAAQAAVEGLYINAGQMCFAGSRLLIDKKVFDPVVEKIVGIVKDMKVGPGWDPNTDLGPVITAKAQDGILSYIQSAQEDNVEILTGGRRCGERGFFVEPTVMNCPDPNIKVVSDEVFGPVLTATPFEDSSDIMAVAREANNTEYGLTASIWTKDLSRTHRLAAEIKAGMIWVNAAFMFDEGLPFGGYKQSGWGREGSRLGVEEFMQHKSVMITL